MGGASSKTGKLLDDIEETAKGLDASEIGGSGPQNQKRMNYMSRLGISSNTKLFKSPVDDQNRASTLIQSTMIR